VINAVNDTPIHGERVNESAISRGGNATGDRSETDASVKKRLNQVKLSLRKSNPSSGDRGKGNTSDREDHL
jgi:hypothetical protein